MIWGGGSATRFFAADKPQWKKKPWAVHTLDATLLPEEDAIATALWLNMRNMMAEIEIPAMAIGLLLEGLPYDPLPIKRGSQQLFEMGCALEKLVTWLLVGPN